MKRLAFAAAVLMLAVAASVSAQNKGMTVTAHTGAYDMPDNSMEFIHKALEMHPAIIEIDIRCRPDGSIAMSHDSIKSNDEGEDVAEVFSLMKGTDIRMNLDIKQTAALKGLYKLIRKYGLRRQVFMTGLGEPEVPVARVDCPRIKYYLNCSPDTSAINDPAYQEELLAKLKETGSIGVNCNYKYANGTLCELLHRNGYLLSVWTVNDSEDAARMIGIGVDNITTRKPEVINALL